MFVGALVILLGILFVYGSIGNYSILQLFLGKQVKSGGSTIPQGTPTNPSVGTQPTPGQTSGSVHANAQQWQLLNIAIKYLGTPYKYGGNDPKVGIDCSRFVQLVYSALGINLPRTSYQQYTLGKPVSLNHLQVGDVIFTEPSAAGPGHEGIYVGNNQVQESPHTGSRNEIIPLSAYLQDGLVGIKRYL
jgi:cell wall-associated NlpC family hydrolase